MGDDIASAHRTMVSGGFILDGGRHADFVEEPTPTLAGTIPSGALLKPGQAVAQRFDDNDITNRSQ